MNCKYCGAELEDGVMECPVCGKSQPDEQVWDEPAAEETVRAAGETAPAPEQTDPAEASAVAAEAADSAEESAETADGAEESAEADADADGSAVSGAGAVKTCGKTGPCAGCETLAGCEQAEQYFADELAAQKKARRAGAKKLVLGVVAGVLVIAIIATVLAVTLTGGKIAHTNEAGYLSYTATQEQLTDRTLNRVVATCGSSKLTNRELGFYYWQQYYSFANAYGSYLPYLMDTSLGLDEQLYDESLTWQQQLLSAAVTNFHHISAMVQQAKADGFTLDAERQAYLDTLADMLEESAANYGYESAEAFIQQQFGPSATVDGYVRFAGDNILALAYLQSLADARSYTPDDVSKYYDEHAEQYAQQRVQKLDTPNIDIRHILIIPAEQNEDGTYTDEAWQEAQRQAEQLLQQWQAGEASEESFAELAISNSADGSAPNGGLISGVYPGQMVDEFNDWCFDDARKVGDTGIVKSQFGYHVMYLSAIGDEIHWYAVAEQDYRNELAATIEDEITGRYALKQTLDNAAIYDVLAAAGQ